MKSYRKELWFETKNRRELINITRQIQVCVAESGIKEGLVLVNAMHITSSVFINDDEMLEVTPKNLRLRKVLLNKVHRVWSKRKNLSPLAKMELGL